MAYLVKNNLEGNPFRACILFLVLLFLQFSSAAWSFDRRTPVVIAVEKVGHAVVNIRTEQVIQRRSSPLFGFADPFFDDFFKEMVPPRTYTTQALGSGVIIDPDGHVLTNAHVIEKASRIFVALPEENKELEASLVGMDEQNDLAVLKIDKKRVYPYLKPAVSDDLMIGETVIAIGNPLGLGHSITTGVVSAQRRRITMGEGVTSVFIQTDALINPGNSGGPLLNINGDLIGINTAIAKQAQGIGFAIPIDTAKRVVADLIEFGHLRRPYAGLYPGKVSEAFTRARGNGGVLVTEVDSGSPAQHAGIHMADVILALDDNTVTSPADYFSLLATYTPRDSVSMTILRGTETLTVQVALASMPKDTGLRYAERTFGFAVKSDSEGVLVSNLTSGSPAESIGLRPGDRVAEVGGVKVATQQEFSRRIEELMGRESIQFLFVRGNRGYYVELP